MNKRVIKVSKPRTTASRLQKIAQDTLRIGDLGVAVSLPPGEVLDEWLAVKTIEFYKEVSLLYGCLTEFCTGESCPTMSAGQRFEYLWADSTSSKRPLKVPAAKYIGRRTSGSRRLLRCAPCEHQAGLQSD